ncbi:baseplate J/gp47 family protein [Jeongeupia sp. USM3]|uniref:baseplate J/gp47 family protein n=1 Tax=Jeongeupia sp. USM3 TaxID=1906741 RepID=UPI00089DE018|nr:baseplate J/gp47 family protein [Jeongeupia sp. USM3]AOY00093.1 hypothetical protein BJP62_06295 [Jeongeupia sp. USM3]
MPFGRPDLPVLIERTRNDVVSRLDGDPLRRADAEVSARVQAGLFHELYGLVSWVADQLFADTADESELVRHANRWGVPRKDAAAAYGTAWLLGQPGAIVRAATVLQRADGVQYFTRADVVIGAVGVEAVVQAVELGAAGNAAGPVALTPVSPVAGLASVSSVAGFGGGADVEALPDWRARILDRQRRPPHGGNIDDYRRWALEVAGVTRAWPLAGYMGLGAVGVLVLRDGDANPIPDAAALALIQSYLDMVRPVTAEVKAIAPVASIVPLSIRLRPDSIANRAAVSASLASFFRRVPVPGARLERSNLVEAISLATGEESHDLVSPAASVDCGPLELATMGGITWLS